MDDKDTFVLLKKLISLSTIVILMVSCGSNLEQTTGPVSSTNDSLFINVGHTGDGDGSVGSPYHSITKALAAAKAGAVLIIAAGEYSTGETYPLSIKPGMTLKGAGRDLTLIRGPIVDMNIADTRPVILQDLYCEGFTFGRDSASQTVTGTNTVKHCKVLGDVESVHRGGHHFLVDNCEIVGNVKFGHGRGESHDIVLGCTIRGSVSFKNGGFNDDGHFLQVIKSCSVSGGIFFGCGAGAIDTVANCEIDSVGIIYNSGRSDVCIAYNIIKEGQISDKSGAGLQYIGYNLITCSGHRLDMDPAGIYAVGSSGTIIHNTISVFGGVSGIVAKSGSPTIIDSNVIHVSGDGICLSTESSTGQMVGNRLVGGSIGAVDLSGATLVAYNVVDSSVKGIISKSAARYLKNTVVNCTGDAMTFEYSGQSVDSNVIVNNGGAGIRLIDSLIGSTGDQHAGLKGNTITGNTGWDLVNETADTVWARDNLWDHPDYLTIDSCDVYDDDENHAYGPVLFAP